MGLLVAVCLRPEGARTGLAPRNSVAIQAEKSRPMSRSQVATSAR
jgi:hypothetical protein